MRLRDTGNAVELIGVENTTGFNIQANGKAFDILSKGLYTDPILAVIRELSCNAYDAMVEAGKGDTPFAIHLPTKLEPYFSVKDKGIGLSDKDVRGLYSTYFASTKTLTNNQIGAFGLGSKSPFSYSKAFDVIACWEGKIRTYSVFMDDEGIPTMAELACVDTTEENGIEVKIAVRQDDYDIFKHKTASILRYFPVKPIITGMPNFEFNTHDESATVTEKFIVDNSVRNSDLIAVQGNVPYRVHKHQLVAQLDNRSAEAFLERQQVTLFFDIGELDVAANREEVRYDDETVRVICDAVEHAFECYLDCLDKDILAMDINGKRHAAYTTLAKRFTNSQSLKTLVGKFKFTSPIVNEWIESSGRIEYTLDWKYHKLMPYAGGDLRVVKCKHETAGYGNSATYYIIPGGKITLLRQDVTKGGSMRMNTLVGKGWGAGTILAIVPITDRALATDGVTVTKRQRTLEFNKIKKMFGSPIIQNLSEITEDIKAERKVRQAGNVFKQFEDDRWVRNKRSKPIFNEASEPVWGGLYIEIDYQRNLIVGDEKLSWAHSTFMEHVDLMLHLINYVNGTDIEPKNVYGLSKKVAKNVGDNVKWISLIDAYKESFLKVLGVAEYHKRVGNSPLSLDFCVHKKDFQDMVASLPKDSSFRDLVEPVIETSKIARNLSYHAKYDIDRHGFYKLGTLNDNFGLDIAVDQTPYFVKEDFEDYKMLEHIDLEYDRYMNDAREYIELVEQV